MVIMDSLVSLLRREIWCNSLKANVMDFALRVARLSGIIVLCGRTSVLEPCRADGFGDVLNEPEINQLP